MAGSGRNPRTPKLPNSMAETSRNSSIVSTRHIVQEQEQEQEQDSNFPTEVLEVILSWLALKDNICVSVVCKRWLAGAISVRKADKNPWLMEVPRSGNLFEFYDPAKSKLYHLNLLKLEGSGIFYSKGAWLLCVKLRTHRVFLFNPYSQEMIKFPKLTMDFKLLAFSSPPTSPNCILFAINSQNTSMVTISTCRLGDTGWTTSDFENPPVLYMCSAWDSIVYSNGLFFCLSIIRDVGVYNPEQQTWDILGVVVPNLVLLNDYPLMRKFVAEHNGNIYVVYPGPPRYTVVFKLNLHDQRWERLEDLGGTAVFGNSRSSYVRTDLLGNLRDKIYFPKINKHGMECVTYSLRDQQFYPEFHAYYLEELNHKKNVWINGAEDELDHKNNVWIDAPEDLSIFSD